MPKLLEQVRTVIRTRHYSLRTDQAYIDWIKKYIVFTTMINAHVLNRRLLAVNHLGSAGRPAPLTVK